MEVTLLPDLHLLKNIGRSPSGTPFPRYLVTGLHELRELAQYRGGKYYNKEYEKTKVIRKQIIHQWQEENPESVLAFDPVSVYRTWPIQLMNRLDAEEQAAIRRGWERYIADLQETEKEMQKLFCRFEESVLHFYFHA